MSLRRFTGIRGQAYKVVPLPSRELRGQLAAVDHAQRIVFTNAAVTDTQEQGPSWAPARPRAPCRHCRGKLLSCSRSTLPGTTQRPQHEKAPPKWRGLCDCC